MPYKLINAGFRTLSDDATSFSTLVRLGVEEKEGDCIASESDGRTILIDFDEWPLIVEAVDKLLAKASSEDDEPAEQAISKKFLADIGFNLLNTQSVLQGRTEDLEEAFIWSRTPQGFKYWKAVCHGEQPLTKADKKLLQSWVDAYRFYERKDND